MTMALVHGWRWDESDRRRLVGLCAHLTGDRQSAEDLAQETLLEAWRNGEKLVDPAGADRWLAAIARNVCLRWARRRGRELELRLVPAESAELVADERVDLELELERAELVELLDGALALLGADAREALVRRYVHGATHAEIAAFLGVSEDAVSMRLARGKLQLRRLLAPDLAAGDWRATRVWCAICGRRRLLQRVGGEEIAFRCPGCNGDGLSHEARLGNPVFAQLLHGVVRPTAILGRLAHWSRTYFAGGTGRSSCTSCGAPVAVEPDPDRLGLRATCPACGCVVCSSVPGLALALPEVRAFRKVHPRTHVLPPRELEHAGVAAVAVRCADRLGNAGIDVVFARNSLRLLTVGP
jgi:RNA polymerase sigma factor (sigma-70 family)